MCATVYCSTAHIKIVSLMDSVWSINKAEVVVINNSFLFLFTGHRAPRSPSPPSPKVSATAQSQLHDFPLLFPSKFDANDCAAFLREHILLVRFAHQLKYLMKWNHKLLAIHSPRLAPRLMMMIIIKIVRSEWKNYDISEGSVRRKLMEMQKKRNRNNERRNKDTEMSMLIFTISYYNISFRFMHVFLLLLFHKRLCADQTNYILFNWLLFFCWSTPSLVL